jgi:addiction module RelE/StbE family toxin
MYEVILSKNFSKQFYKLPKAIQERTKKILEKLKTRLLGDMLKGDLLGFYSVHFESNKYRLIYHKADNEIRVLVLHVGRRTDSFYEDFKRELKKGM